MYAFNYHRPADRRRRRRAGREARDAKLLAGGQTPDRRR